MLWLLGWSAVAMATSEIMPNTKETEPTVKKNSGVQKTKPTRLAVRHPAAGKSKSPLYKT